MRIYFYIFILFISIGTVSVFANSEKDLRQTTTIKTQSNVSHVAAIQPISETQFKTTIKDLVNQRRAAHLKIYEERVELIRNDPALRILHEAILALHEKMAKQLNDNEKMVPLLDKEHELDRQIQTFITTYQAQHQGSTQ